ncbi:MAG: hypothetical protein Q8R45_05335 [Brevundimonas sp.]|uniref:hypothetical protein n=1 Tax=Brevundimonas sp. TaxID=1871086 RepID=UPI00271BAA85|nr:hypothetical protein [Brevundimonas sp.]MDO9588597.1 hypothetical protein [Brevundimonas sp.]MDP3369833.1 hypothetical protein [Brevundimonas sp.]MDP3656373.1 hypothetical protein [Brevundimonas sp.]MDZ4113357.1 hypothetical protein [Brevundimonas sp.]
MRPGTIAAVGAGLVVLAGCQQAVEAPFDPGVCYAVEAGAEGEAPRFNKVADNQPQIEFCAARLEEVRLRFLRMGGSRQEIIGSYQGQFIFIDRAGVWISRTLDGGRFNLLARTGDGRLAMPGAIQRAIDGAPLAVSATTAPDPTAPTP